MRLIDLWAAGRNWLAELPDATRAAWRWDMAAGVFAGAYVGCVWTFVARVARAELHATEAQMGWLAAAPALGYVLATLWAKQMDGKAKLPFVYWTWLVARGLFILAPMFATRGRFMLLVCVTPFIFSVSTPAYTAIMKEIYPDHLRGRLMSAVRVLANTTTLVTALIAGRLLDSGVPWQGAFSVGGALGVLSAWAFSRIRVPETRETGDCIPGTGAFIRDTLDILRRNPGYRWYTASVFVYGFGNIVASTIYPLYWVDHFHVSNSEVANIQNIGAMMTIVGFFFWGPFMDRRGPLVTVFLSVAIVCIMPVCYALADHIGWVYAASAAGGIAMSGIDLGYLNSTLLFSEPGRAAQYQALHSSFFGIRGSIAPHCAIPLLQRVGARNTFWVSLGIMLMGVGLQVASMRDHRRRGART